MILSGWLLFVLTLLLGFITFAILLWTVIKWRDKHNRTIGCGLIFLFTILTIICTIIMTIKAVKVAKTSTTDEIEKRLDIFTNAMSARSTNTSFMDSIKSMQPTDSILPDSYLSYAGLRDYYRMPLVYPYSLSAIDALDEGTIEDESGIRYIAKDANKSKQVLHGITLFCFDKNILLAKVEPLFSADTINYYILGFKTGQLNKFDSETEMKIQAAELGFDTVKPMVTPREYYYLF